MDVERVLGRVPEGVDAEHVAAVVLVERADVHRDYGVAANGVVRGRQDDGAERARADVDDVAIGALVSDRPLHLGRKLEPRHALAEALTHGQVAPLRARHCAPEPPDLLGRLDHADGVEVAGRVDQGRPRQGRFETAEHGHRHLGHTDTDGPAGEPALVEGVREGPVGVLVDLEGRGPARHVVLGSPEAPVVYPRPLDVDVALLAGVCDQEGRERGVAREGGEPHHGKAVVERAGVVAPEVGEVSGDVAVVDVPRAHQHVEPARLHVPPRPVRVDQHAGCGCVFDLAHWTLF